MVPWRLILELRRFIVEPQLGVEDPHPVTNETSTAGEEEQSSRLHNFPTFSTILLFHLSHLLPIYLLLSYPLFCMISYLASFLVFHYFPHVPATLSPAPRGVRG